MKKKLFLVVILLVIVLSACAGIDASPEISAAETAASPPTQVSTATLEPTQTRIMTVPPLFDPESQLDLPTLEPTKKSTSTPTSTPDPTSTLTPTPTPLPEARILTNGSGMQSPGPWLMFSVENGTYILSQDAEEIGFIPYLSGEIYDAPTGGNYAVLDWYNWDFELEIRSIQSNEIFLHEDLLGYDGPIVEFDEDESLFVFDIDRQHGVGDLDWSHDGRSLTFVGSIYNYSTDVYTFNLDTGRLTQLANTPPLSVRPYWSPDDAYILFADVTTLNSEANGSGYNDWEVFSSDPEGTNITSLFNGLEYGHEELLGWVSDDQALMYSEHWWCGGFDLRTVNIKTRQVQKVFPDIFYTVGYDPVSQVALVWVPSYETTLEECVPELEPGLYLVSVPEGNLEFVEILTQDFVNWIEWDEITSQFLVAYYGMWAVVDLAGTATVYEDQPIMSPDGEWIALLGDDEEFLQVLEKGSEERIRIENGGEAIFPVWSMDGETLFFFHRERENWSFNLYMAQAPEFEPVLLIKSISKEIRYSPQWVMP